jgi:hypothetical protein
VPKRPQRLKSALKLQLPIVLAVAVVVGALGVASQTWWKTETVVAEWPTTPPAQICGNAEILGGGPTTPPAGAIVVPAGDNSNLTPNWHENGFSAQDKTFWFAPGVHTLGTDEFDQIQPGNGSTYIGAPGAIIDGQGLNRFPFTGQATNVRIAYLEVKNFTAPLDQGSVNHGGGRGWTIEYNWIHDNGGAGIFAGPANTIRYNCVADNSQYGLQILEGKGSSDITLIDHNEIARNNTGDWENINDGCGCTGGFKGWLSNNAHVTNNWVHHNYGVGMWFDNNNRGTIIEGNYISDNDGQAIFLEAGYDARVRYNNIVRNSWAGGRSFQSRGDGFPYGTIYVSEAGAPSSYGLTTVPMVISNNNFDNNWGGVALWENPNRYSGSGASTHIAGTIKVGDLYTDTDCDAPDNLINAAIADKYDCRWSTESVVVESNVFKIDKAAIGAGCVGDDYCGVQAIFSTWGGCEGCGFDPEFAGYTIPWKISFQQQNVFRNNQYYGDWTFVGFDMGTKYTWDQWRAAAPAVPADLEGTGPPNSMGQDSGSTLSATIPAASK